MKTFPSLDINLPKDVFFQKFEVKFEKDEADDHHHFAYR
jgi:hypothetical protein